MSERRRAVIITVAESVSVSFAPSKRRRAVVVWRLLLLLLLLLLAVGATLAALSSVTSITTTTITTNDSSSSLLEQQQQQRKKRGLLGDEEKPESSVDLEDALDEDDIEEDYVELNVTAEKSKYLGSPCDLTCNPTLAHVFCSPQSKFCECEKSYPVQLGPTKGCAKPKKLGEQCLYQATCMYSDQHSICKQVQHNAVCECGFGYHRVPVSRSNKKLFCAADLVLIATDLPTLLGVASGIAVFTGGICFALKLFSRARYTRPRHYANAGHTGPMLFSSDTGIPLTLHHGGRPPSRSSQRSSAGTLNYVVTRKPSYANSGEASSRLAGGSLVPASRAGAARAAAILLISCGQTGDENFANSAAGASVAGAQEQPTNGANNKHRRALSDVAEVSSDGLGSRRPSVASIHSSTSSAKSYSARRFERERNEKEQRHALIELKLKQHQQQHQQQHQPVPPVVIQATPSPRTPHSTDELLPCVEEGSEIFGHEQGQPTLLETMVTTIDPTTSKVTTSIATVEETTATANPIFEGDAKPGTSAVCR